MRRAAGQALRIARRGPFRKLLVAKSAPIHTTGRLTPSRSGITAAVRKDVPPSIIQSSMYFRNFSIAALVSALASGVWYYQQDHSQESRALFSQTSGSALAPNPALSYAVSTPTNQNPQTSSTSTTVSTTALSPTAETGLAIKDENFYYAEIADDAPLTKQGEDDGLNKMQELTPEQATRKLRRLEKSYNVGRGKGVIRYDLVQVPSNNPIEDDHAESIVEMPLTGNQEGDGKSDWMFWGVFDGHSGWTTSAKLRQVLISYVARELNGAYKPRSGSPVIQPSAQSIDSAIKRGFVRLDHDIVNVSVQNLMNNKTKVASTEALAPALSGACALLSFYDTSTNLFRVACTGDSRAVLGRRGSTGKWTATALSEDQTGGTSSEMSRLRAEHPGEPEVVLAGRILGGLEPSRAFGDATYKWTREVQNEVRKRFFGRSPPARLRTPPYVTAEPIVTTTKIEPGKGDFVVLATDGLWEMLTNEEVIGLVGQWIEKQKSLANGSSPWSWAKSFASTDKALPVERPASTAGEGGGQRAPIRQEQWSVKSSDDRFVVEDKNVATHLVRNALGGRDQGLVCSLLSLVSPYARRYRDDLTVEVIFFGEGDSGGNVVMNHDASNPSLGAKAKL